MFTSVFRSDVVHPISEKTKKINDLIPVFMMGVTHSLTRGASTYSVLSPQKSVTVFRVVRSAYC